MLMVAACTSGAPAPQYVDKPAIAQTCEELYAQAPEQVAGQQRRAITDDRGLAWGDDAIMMHCGVRKPDGLDRASRCDFVAGVGWFTHKDDDYYTFTTIGREAYVSVVVPRSYSPAADVLVDLAPTVQKNDPVVTPCV